MPTRSPGLKLYLAQQGRWAATRAERRLAERLELGEEHTARGAERLGKATAPRPEGPLIWFHVGSETDAMAIPELVSRLRAERDELNVLVTTATYDPDMPLAEHLPEAVIHQYAPYDFLPAVQAFVAHWRPDLCLWSDSRLRPALIEETYAAGIPLIMMDGRMDDETQHRWRWFPGMARTLLSRFERLLVGDDRTAANLRRLGVSAHRIQVAGFLQEGGTPLPCLEAERDGLAELLAARPVWLAVGIDPAEDSLVSAAHRHAIRRSHRLLLLAVPDQPQRGEALAEFFAAEGWTVARRGAEEEPDPDVQIYVADLPDELGLWYRLAPCCFMGQTLAKGSGRHPYEAAALGSAVLFGPEGRKYSDAYARLEGAGAAIQVRNERELGAGVEFLLAPDVAARMATAAWDVSTSGAEVTDRLSELIFDALDEKRV